MPNAPLYPNSKPVDGDVLVLCEGDAVGYEPHLLKLWADGADLAGRFVKVLPCGTGDGLYGMADAVGRTVPIIVIEDRDFRTYDEARGECDKKLKNREGRSVAMRGWCTWRRAEIENYFVDDTVLPQVFSAAFDCEPDAVRDAICAALRTLAVEQALEYALYRARKNWLTTDANRALRVSAIDWTLLLARPAVEVRASLDDRLKKWQKSLHDGAAWKDPMAGEQLLDDFDAKYAEWCNVQYDNDAWRQNWACKEVLKFVRMKLSAAKEGWWSHPSARNAPIVWSGLSTKERDDHDRRLERQLQPDLVQAVGKRLDFDATFDLRNELEQLAEIIRRV